MDCQEYAHVPRDANFPVSLGKYQKKARSPLHNVGSTLRSDHLRVCRVSAMTITLAFTSMSCNKNVSSEHTSASLSVSSSVTGTYKRSSDHCRQVHSSLFFHNRQSLQSMSTSVSPPSPDKHTKSSPCTVILKCSFGFWNNAAQCLPLRKPPDSPQNKFT